MDKLYNAIKVYLLYSTLLYPPFFTSSARVNTTQAFKTSACQSFILILRHLKHLVTTNQYIALNSSLSWGGYGLLDWQFLRPIWPLRRAPIPIDSSSRPSLPGSFGRSPPLVVHLTSPVLSYPFISALLNFLAVGSLFNIIGAMLFVLF